MSPENHSPAILVALPGLRHVEGRIAALSLITVGELLFGSLRRDWGER